MGQISIIWFVLCLFFTVFPLCYYTFLRYVSRKPWNLKVHANYLPFVTILIPTYNEAEVIEFKLENLCKIKYPKDKMQIILVDSASTDGTLDKVYSFIEDHPEISMEILNEKERKGKSNALNLALKYSKGEVIVVSDADCFLSPDILRKALPFLYDPSVGALTGREVLLNPDQSWVTQTEKVYRESMEPLLLGESKLHSTIFFEGGFSAYKRVFLKEFDSETGCDDSGTALNILLKGYKTIFIPEATFFTFFPTTWKGKITIKIRRAGQLIRIWFKCLQLSLKGRKQLPKKIVLPEFFLYVIAPLTFLILTFVTFFFFLENLNFAIFFSVFLLFALAIPKIRIFLFEAIQNQLILLIALFSLLLNKNFIIWKKADESRLLLTKEAIERKKLI